MEFKTKNKKSCNNAEHKVEKNATLYFVRIKEYLTDCNATTTHQTEEQNMKTVKKHKKNDNNN